MPPTHHSALELVFPQSSWSNSDSASWFSQGLQFSSSPNLLLPVLLQRKGGPCGVLACVQAHVVLHSVFKKCGNPLVMAVCEVALLIRNDPNIKRPFDPNDPSLQITYLPDDQVEERIRMYCVTHLQSPAGVMMFVLSVICTRGVARVKADMDDSDAVMTGQFGHCGQEMLNLLLTGQAVSQVHDGVVDLGDDSGIKLRGVSTRPNVGFLTVLERMRYCQVGAFLKNPEFPIWVIGSESHFTVLYSPDRNCDAKTPAQQVLERVKRAFHARDAHDNGLINVGEVRSVLKELGMEATTPRDERAMEELLLKLNSSGAVDDVVLWSDFWHVIGPLIKSGKGLAGVPDVSWACSVCTFENVDLKSNQCFVCQSARPQLVVPLAPPLIREPWVCGQCTLVNPLELSVCEVCGSLKTSPTVLSPQLDVSMDASEMGGRTIELVHVDGLERTVYGVLQGARVNHVRLTTVDSALADHAAFMGAVPFEEVVKTKWPSAIFDYGQGGKAPSIEG